MSNPLLTLSPSPVTSLGSHSYSVLEDDYGVNKLTFKAKAGTSTGGVFNFKLAQDIVKNSQTQEVKIQFPYKKLYIWAGFRPTEYKAHVDFGEFQILKKLRLYANVKYSLTGGKYFTKLGAVHYADSCTSHTRIEHENNEFSFTSRALAKEKDFRIGSALTYNISKNAPTRYDVLLGFLKPDVDFFLRHYSTSKTSLKLGRVLGNIVFRHGKKQTLGLEAELDDKQNPSLTLGGSLVVNDYTYKAKANLSKSEVFFSVKGKVDDKWIVTLSGQVPVGKTFTNNSIFPIPLAVTVETSI